MKQGWKRYRPKSLRIKLLSIVVGLLGVGIGLLSNTFVNEYTELLRSDLTSDISEFANLATPSIGSTYLTYQDAGYSRIRQQMNSFTISQPAISNVSIADIEADIVFQLEEDPSIAISIDSARSLNRTIIFNQDGSLSTVIQPYIEDSGVHRYNVIYSVDSSEINNLVSHTSNRLLTFALIGALVIVASLAVTLDLWLVRPIKGLKAASVNISRGKFKQELYISRNDEIGELSIALTEMASNLKNDIDTLKRLDGIKSEFMSIISHNLRGPLTVIQGQIENIGDSNDIVQIKTMLDSTNVHVMRLFNIIEGAITISRLELGSQPLGLEPTDIAPVLEKIAADFEIEIGQSNRKFNKAIIGSHSKLHINQALFKTAIWNILDNSMKFTDDGGTITLSTSINEKQFMINIQDNGIGISADQLPFLFTKYHRGTDLMNYNYEGQGLGLYISKLIINRHNGDIKVESSEGSGTIVTVSLPVYSASGESQYF